MFRTASRKLIPSVAMARQKHTLPDLPYDYNALEPTISADIMKLHHQVHHAAYVTNLNLAEERFGEAKEKGDLKTMISVGPLLRFHGGGHLNHSIFWQNLSPNGGGEPTGDLLSSINRDFGSFQNFKTILTNSTVAIQGSGWGWLGYNRVNKTLITTVCPNQDPLEPTTGIVPLLGIDVWEHAYYLQYKSGRAAYVNKIWDIINWKDVAERLEKARG